MAAGKPATNHKSDKKASMKTTENRVAKRPARGYHKFKNGMLNVTPKGGEKELVNNNQKSPLLRLSPEIRNYIWTLVLGGMTLRPVDTKKGLKWLEKIMPILAKQYHSLALLRTSRQVYQETALLPLESNTFSIPDNDYIKRVFKPLKVYQLQHISSIRLEVTGRYSEESSSQFKAFRTAKSSNALDFLPGLQSIQMSMFEGFHRREAISEKTKNRTLEQFKALVAGRDLKVSIEVVSSHWYSYDKPRACWFIFGIRPVH